MTQANTPHPLWVLVNKRGQRLRHLKNNSLMPVFDYPIQALRYAEGLGINGGVYDIINLRELLK